MGKVKEKKEVSEVKKKNMDSKKKNAIIIITSVIAVILLFIISIIISESKIDSTYKIAEKLSNKLGNEYGSVTLIEEEKDKNFEYSYLYTTLIYLDDIGKYDKNGTEDNSAIAIAKYNSNIEAKKKEEFFNSLNKIAHDKFDNTIAEEYNDFDSLFISNSIVIKGKYLFSINPKIKNQEQIKKYIDEIIKDFDTKDEEKVNESDLNTYWEKKLSEYEKDYENTYNKLLDETKKTVLGYVDDLEGCTGNKCDELLNEVLKLEKYKEIENEITTVKNKYNEIIKGKEKTVNSINSSISNINSTLNQEQFDSVKKQIEELADSYYDKYKENWKTQLNSIEEKVYKNSCGRYSYKDLLRNPTDYQYKKAYFFGQVLQKVSSTQYRVGIDCTKYSYISGYHCDNTIYVTYYGENNLIEDDMINMWGTMDGTQTYTTVMGASVTIPKFYAKYISLK